MKIIYTIAGTRHSGGMERVLANKANWLVGHGYEVCIVTTDQHGEPPYFPLDERIRRFDLGIGYEDNNGASFLNKVLHYPFKQYRHRRRLEALLLAERADVVVSMFCNEASFLPKIKDGSRKVLEIHFSRNKLLQYGRKGLWALADKWRSNDYEKIAGRYDRFVVLTEEDSRDWRQMSGGKCQVTSARCQVAPVVIPNSRTFCCAKPALLENKEVIAVGRYNYQKGYDRLIQAWNLVHRQMPDWSLRILGDGELRGELEKMAEGFGLSDCIRFGRAEHDIEAIYQQASILALTSRYEGLPMVLLEAQAAGLPVVSFDCKCGPRDVIRDGENGFLVPDGDINLFADRLIALMQDEVLRLRLGHQAFMDSAAYDEEAIMQRWVQLFENL